MDEAREPYWHEEEPRIVAQGRWQQDEHGDISYIPEHIRPVRADDEDLPADPVEERENDDGAFRPDPVVGDGYRIRSERVWAAARRDYLAGDTAEAVCARHGLKLGTLRHRAAHEGWRRCDSPDPEPLDLTAETADGPPDLGVMARHAAARMQRAIRLGRAAEAASWLRTWRALADPTLLTPEPEPLMQAPLAPEPVDAAQQHLAAIAAIARDAASSNLHDPAARAGIEARMAALEANGASLQARSISDDSDDSDAVFSGEAPSAPPAEEAP